MSNEEFINMLIVSGKLSPKELDNDIKFSIKTILKSDRFIGNFYKSLCDLGFMNNSMILYTIAVIVLGYNIKDEYADIFRDRYKILYNHLDLSHFTQTLALSDQLKSDNKKDMKSLLYKCNVKGYITSQQFYYKNCLRADGRTDKTYMLFRLNSIVSVTDMETGKRIIDDLKYILIEKDSRFPIFIDKKEFKSSMYNKHRNLFKIYV